MKNVKRLNHDELSTMSNAEKERLIIHLFDLVADLESELENVSIRPHDDDANNNERRKFQRNALPALNSNYCEIMLAEPTENSTSEYKRNYWFAIDKAKHNSSRHWHKSNEVNFVAFRLNDISMAGCSMVNHDEEFSYFLTPDKIYENCKIIATRQEKITVSFKIMTKFRLEPCGLHKFNELIGVQFLDVKRHQQYLK